MEQKAAWNSYRAEEEKTQSFRTPDTQTAAPELMYLDYCGTEVCRPGHSFGPCVRSEYVIHFIIRGCGYLWNRDRRFDIERGNMFVLFPGEENLYRADRIDPWHYCWIGFHGDLAEKYVEKIGFTRDNPVLLMSEGEAVEEIIRELLGHCTNETSDEVLRETGLTTIMGYLLRENGQEHAGDPDTCREVSYVEFAKRYMERHFGERVRIAGLAAQIGVSRSYLTQLFHDSTGISPQKYLIRLRMEHAENCLKLTEDAIQDIAAECGYEDPLAFSKVFKLRYGVSPRKYREIYGVNPGTDGASEKAYAAAPGEKL